MKVRQEDMDGKLDTMRNENEALWGEVLNLRQKHSQQQKIVNKSKNIVDSVTLSIHLINTFDLINTGLNKRL